MYHWTCFKHRVFNIFRLIFFYYCNAQYTTHLDLFTNPSFFSVVTTTLALQDDRYVIAGFTNTFDNFAEFVLLDTMSSSYSVNDPNILRLDASPECTAVLPREEAVTGLRNGDLVVWSIRTGKNIRILKADLNVLSSYHEVRVLCDLRANGKDNQKFC